MAWPERLGLGVAVLVLLVTAFLGNAVWDRPYASGAYLNMMGGVLFGLELFFAFPAWVLARVIDFIIGGPQRRKASRNSN
jgi:uncharacterized membrane protein